jgi:NitT/TauT family transport system substrate-binding protein
VEITEYDSAAELYDALETGAVDVVAGDLDGPFFDAVFRTGTGAGPRVVLGGPIAAHAQDTKTPQTGLWLRTDLLDEPDNFIDLEDIKQPVAVQDSIADVVTYPIDFVLQQDDISLNEVQTSTTSGEEAAKMLLSEELSGAWLTDPWWREVVDSDLQIELVATLPVSESLGGVVFAPRLLDPQRDRIAGLAFARAVVRTINTYLGQDYQEDDDVVDALVEVTGETKDDIVHTPAWVFDWELRLDTTSRIQEGMILLGGVVYEDDLPEPRLVDRTIYKEVVAQADQ